MKITTAVLLAFLFIASTQTEAQSPYSSIYAFGDSVSSTTSNVSSVPSLYYGRRYCNGRVWIEVISERLGITYDSSKNKSWYGHYSSDLLDTINAFSATDATNSLFIVWVNDADFVYAAGAISPPYTTNASLTAWNQILNASLNNHSNAIQQLYNKGARTFIMPNAVDLGKVPYYTSLSASDRRFIRDRATSYNASFSTRLQQARNTYPGITIYMPDFLGLMDAIHTNAAAFGLIKPGVSAVDDPALTNKAWDGPGANYVFWDYMNPTAKSHMHMTDLAMEMFYQARIQNIFLQGSSNRLDLTSVSIGKHGYVATSTNFSVWSTNGPALNTNNAVQSVYVVPSAPREFYRLRFPFSWVWP